MIKRTLKRIPEDWYYDFEEETCFNDSFLERVIICGNSDFKSYGDKELISVIKNDYYDEEKGYDYDILEQLEKLTHKKWEKSCFRGCNQGDWQHIYFAIEEVSSEELHYLEDFYMGDVECFDVEEENEEGFYQVYIPYNVCWNGKIAICEYLGFHPENTTVLVDVGYHKVYDYEELK